MESHCQKAPPRGEAKLLCAIVLSFFALLSPARLFALGASTYVSAGTFGAEGFYADGSPGYAIAGNVLALTAVHEGSGLGIEVSPFAFRIGPSGEYAGISLVNLSVFHRTIRVTDESILGPFASVN